MATTQKQKREFILKTLLPYKKDIRNCAVSTITGNCLYLTEDGKKCAVGVHLKKGKWQDFREGYYSLIDKFDKNNIFKKSALKHELPDEAWNLMQKYHDALATGYGSETRLEPLVLEKLLGISLPELYTK